MCKLAIYCVNFGVNFILRKFCLCKKNYKYEVWDFFSRPKFLRPRPMLILSKYLGKILISRSIKTSRHTLVIQQYVDKLFLYRMTIKICIENPSILEWPSSPPVRTVSKRINQNWCIWIKGDYKGPERPKTGSKGLQCTMIPLSTRMLR